MATKEVFFEYLLEILKRPAMYGVKNVEDIRLIFTTEILINNNDTVGAWSRSFNEFVRKDINSHLINFDWSKIIRLYSGSDAHSIELFYKLFKSFQEKDNASN